MTREEVLGTFLDAGWSVVFRLLPEETTCTIFAASGMQLGFAAIEGRNEHAALELAGNRAVATYKRLLAYRKKQEERQQTFFETESERGIENRQISKKTGNQEPS